jgi:NADH:ubiquinone oxidoreductase subunit 5 (subunit L)/multisubunit Na+/H+ antiporter MnhA subunit
VIVLILGGLLSATYILAVLRQMLLRADDSLEMQPVPRVMELATFALALGSLLLGVRSIELLEFLEIGGPFPPGSGE